ncbi:hypothetical protein [Amycolatopsis pigmentata]|uniref:Uncharacterized protein n=1 Tax=Amycolatopsis pigmentata TaxID=450801 RepID=A0ABW5FZB4_9PSEU
MTESAGLPPRSASPFAATGDAAEDAGGDGSADDEGVVEDTDEVRGGVGSPVGKGVLSASGDGAEARDDGVGSVARGTVTCGAAGRGSTGVVTEDGPCRTPLVTCDAGAGCAGTAGRGGALAGVAPFREDSACGRSGFTDGGDGASARGRSGGTDGEDDGSAGGRSEVTGGDDGSVRGRSELTDGGDDRAGPPRAGTPAVVDGTEDAVGTGRCVTS